MGWNVNEMSTNGSHHFVELLDELLHVRLVSLVSKSSIIIIILHRHVYIYIHVGVGRGDVYISLCITQAIKQKMQT